MEMTKLTDRVDVLENESKDEVRETGNHGGGVNIETFNFHGEQNTSERTELVQSDSRTLNVTNCVQVYLIFFNLKDTVLQITIKNNQLIILTKKLTQK